MHKRFVSLLMGLAWSASQRAAGHAATLRASTTLLQPQVRICDLFDEAGPEDTRVLGPGPAPGGRIVVEAAQAAAIARQFGVAWRPASPAERVVIDRPGRLVAREDVVGVLRTALEEVGAPASGDLDLAGFSAPLVARDGELSLSIEQVDYNAASGRFTATLVASTPGEALQRIPLAGRLQEMTELVVPTHRLQPGAIVRAEDLHVTRLRSGAWHGDVVMSAAQAVGLAVRHAVAQGQPIPVAAIGPPQVVLRGARVMMLLRAPGISMAAVGQATEPGALGEVIAVLNPASGALVEAEIVAPDQVRVSPDSMPRRPVRAAGIQVSLR